MCYLGDKKPPKYGKSAAQIEKNEKIINRNFKVELGNITPGVQSRALFATECDKDKSAYELTKDFLELILSDVKTNAGTPDEETGKISLKIIVAEPLAFQVEGHSPNWISNYRENIRRILSRYEVVEFLPEPFAVYQYYRYGLRIPQLKDNLKHIALIIDFGGGTFDACVIESTQKGDISLSGKHSKPYASASEPIGGYFVNNVIAEYLIKRGLEGKDRKRADQIIKAYKRVKKGELSLATLNDEKTAFINNLDKIQIDVELQKIKLSNEITNWNIDTEGGIYNKVIMKLPNDPFSISTWSEHDFYVHEFRKLFKDEVWNKHLSKVIKSVLARAHEQLNEKSITTTLISGGSSNIRWLSELLSSEFGEELGNAKPMPLSNSFQEIVAKGLAIECARRHYDSESEFVAVTYNPIRLLLNPDNKGIEKNKFRSIDNKINMAGTELGDLMPSAQALSNFIDIPLQWKVKLKASPKRLLEYYFTRPNSSEDENEYLDCYNVGNTTVHTKDQLFDSQIRIELKVREDGTAIPRFIYKVGSEHNNIPENVVAGNPFVIDMTSDSHENNVVGSYVGVDFGTSNSSICELTTENVQIIEKMMSLG